MRLILMIFILSTIFSCEIKMDDFELITIKNKSQTTLKFHVASENSPVQYPDTILPLNRDELILGNITGTLFWGNSTPWETIINSIPSDTLSIYFFHPDTLETYSWPTIRNDYKILKRYDLSFEDLENLNFEIDYPPNEEMENIKQFPSFED